MNEQQLAELRTMREEQSALRQRLGVLDERLARFEAQAAETVVATLPVVNLLAVTPPPLPVIFEEAVREPVPLADLAADAGWRATKPLPAPPAIPPKIPAGAAAPPPKERESLEMRIGSTWLVRIGVVVALTALAFAGIALYQNIVPHLGPAGKVALLYLGAGVLTGAGAWLERSRQTQNNPRLRDFAQVVLAGGLSAVYYVTYVAHYSEWLRVIDSAILAGVLLLAWTAFMVWLAHRRNSETLATVAILLAYYTAAINDGVAGFTLFSNLALTGGAVFLLRRHLWRVFPFASVLATFGSYGFWTYYHSLLGWRGLDVPPVHAVHGADEFWIEAAFLFVYWALFTWAAFTAGEGTLPSLRRAGFVSLNNSAFFLLTTWLVLGQGPGWFWQWSLGFGLVLLTLAELCRRLPRPADPRTEDAYLLQGVLLVTTGFVAYFDGWQLSAVLAVQTVVTLAAARRRSSGLLLGCSLLTGFLAFAWAVQSFEASPPTGGWLTPLVVGGLLVRAAALAQRFRDVPTQPGTRNLFRQLLDPAPSYYSLLGCVVWAWLIKAQAPGTNSGVLALCGTAILLTASIYGLRVKALTLYAQGFLAMGFLVWASETLFQLTPTSGPNPWTTLGPLVAALALGHWWQRLPGPTGWQRGRLNRLLNAGDAGLAVGTVFVWFISRHWWWSAASEVVPAGLAGLALGVFAYAVATRYRALAVASQGLLLASVPCFFQVVTTPASGGWHQMAFAAVPPLAVLLMLTAGRFLVPSDRTTVRVRIATVCYELLATLLLLVWTKHYLPGEALLPVLTLAGLLVFGLGVECGVRRWMGLSIVPTVVGLCALLFDPGAAENRNNSLVLLGVVFLAGQQQWGERRLGERLPTWSPTGWQAALMSAATLCAWTFVTTRVNRWHGSSFTLTAGWSGFAAVVFAAGLLLRERVYRWLGLLVLAVTLGHVILFDIMRLDSLGKAISLFALAMVLLGVGFLYNKYQSKFRDFL